MQLKDAWKDDLLIYFDGFCFSFSTKKCTKDRKSNQMGGTIWTV